MGCLSQKVQKVVEPSVGVAVGGGSHSMMARPHVHLSRLDTRQCGELRDCGVPSSGRGLVTMGSKNTHCVD